MRGRAIEAPSAINYLAVRLRSGERWRYMPPAGHDVLWIAVGKGAVRVPDRIGRASSVHTSADALVKGERRICEIRAQLVREGRLG